MFEAVVTLCLSLADGPCRDQLLPGHEALTEAACLADLADRGAALPPTGLHAAGNPFCRPVGPALAMVEVAPGVFAHHGLIEEPDTDNRGAVVNLGFVIGTERVAVIDTGSARWMGEALWRAIRARTDKPVSHVILTHMHPDHVLGAAPLAETGASVVGHAQLPRALADRQANYLESFDRLIGTADFLGTVPVSPDLLVADRMEIDLGGRVLELTAWPMAHTGTDLTVLDRATGTLFTGDLVFDDHIPALDGQLMGWQAVLADLAALPAVRIVPGHGGPVLDWPGGDAPLRRYLAVLERDTRAAIEAGQRMGEAVEEIARSEAANWALFDAYNARNATVAFSELEWE
jgi:quinoprotein relay system zinc metallohydrolase 2